MSYDQCVCGVLSNKKQTLLQWVVSVPAPALSTEANTFLCLPRLFVRQTSKRALNSQKQKYQEEKVINNSACKMYKKTTENFLPKFPYFCCCWWPWEGTLWLCKLTILLQLVTSHPHWWVLTFGSENPMVSKRNVNND